MSAFIQLTKLSPGDQVAVVSPSAGLPGLYPWIQDLGLQRLRDIFNLFPVEYPTTRIMGASLKDRARDLMAAFANPNHKAVFASIGGDDQIKLLKYLDPEVFLAHPKPFFGFSDNTHFHNYLSNLHIPSYYGGAVMTQLAMQGQMHEMTVYYLTKALFEIGEVEVQVSNVFNDEGLDWENPANLQAQCKMEPNYGLFWDGTANGTGYLWGGCVESLVAQIISGQDLPHHTLQDTILYLETSENMPPAWVLNYLLTGFGERGWLEQFQAVLVGRPKAWNFDQKLTTAQKSAYRQQQRETVLTTIRSYNRSIPIVQNMDFGHTDPQIVLPSGQKARVLGSEKQIFLTY